MSRPTPTGLPLRARFVGVAMACAVVALLIAEVLNASSGASDRLAAHTAVAFLLIVATALPGVGAWHPFATIGYATWVTTFRSSLVALVAALLLEQPSLSIAWAIIVVASVAAILDSWDGWLARRTRMDSAFGARFDMEIDALLILLLSLVVWRYGKAGGWVVLSGALRYAFVVAGWFLPWLNQALPDSLRRKAVCVVQIVGLIVAVGPIISIGFSTFIAAATLAMLIWSFAVDVAWLWNAPARRLLNG